MYQSRIGVGDTEKLRKCSRPGASQAMPGKMIIGMTVITFLNCDGSPIGGDCRNGHKITRLEMGNL